ncbi:MAG: hypothetical protein JXN59_17400 [Anaerolineae bacterium]|nr:hypothetical protein [Anaerolineae bacterium]
MTTDISRPAPSPADRLRALERQIARLDRRIDALTRQSDRLSSLRLWLVVGGLPLIWGAFLLLRFWFGLAALAVLVVAFTLVVRRHHTVNTSREDHRHYREIKAGHAARLRLDWEALPPPYRAELPPEHPFATDLDIAGPYSLHRLITTATTREGNQRLLDWLLTRKPEAAVIARRQAVLRELIPLTRFRDRLTLTATRGESGLSARWSGQRLLDRLAASPSPAAVLPTLRLLLGLAGANAILLALYLLGALPPLWIGTLLAYVALNILRRDLVGDLFEDALHLADGLRRLGAILGYLERYPLEHQPQLRAICAPITQARTRPSAFLRRVSGIASAASLQANPFLWLPVNLIFPWDFFFAYWLNRQRAALARHLPAWLEAWYDLEASCALATFAALHPEYTFPELVEDAQPPVFEAHQIGHPLIPFGELVRNDFALGKGEITIITGSNMSGKSSFLRTVGVNMALAYAGGAVNAAALRLSRFRLFTSIRVTDSVVDGISYFYAEVRRLRALLDALEADDPAPLFFLIDEIFRGTNNRERLIGSRAYIRALGEKGATGLVSTHDLELIHLAETLSNVRNQHFRETVVENAMHFDYTLRAGPSPTTNALVIMAMEGLPVEVAAAGAAAGADEAVKQKNSQNALDIQGPGD